MSHFLTNLFYHSGSGASNSGSRGLSHKLMVPALLATSVGLYWQYMNTQKLGLEQLKQCERKRIQKLMAKLPSEISDLSQFTAPEIQAITRRNTIKNKLVGRLNKWRLMNQNIAHNQGEPTSSESAELNDIPSEGVIECESPEADDKVGASSIYSTSSIATDSSES